MTKFSSTNQPEHDHYSKAGKASGKARLLSRALEIALKREIDDEDEDGNKTRITQAQKIANTLARNAGNGDVPSAIQCFDRTEGKAQQAIALVGDEDQPPAEITVNFVSTVKT